MDTRIQYIGGRRPHKLLRSDLPVVAQAIIGSSRGHVRVSSGVYSNIKFVRLIGSSLDVVILGEDWIKILPLIQEGSLDDFLIPSTSIRGYSDTSESFDSQRDKLLFDRVLHALQQLFPDDYPVGVA